MQVPLTRYFSLQDLGDIRQLIFCCLNLNEVVRYNFDRVRHELEKALWDVVEETKVWAQQYEVDGRYKDAAYLCGRIHSDEREDSSILPTLAAVYEKIGDYPAAELAQEKLMRNMLAKGWDNNNEEEIREMVETFSRLLNLFHTRLQVLGPASQSYAKLSIVNRAAALDLEQLNAALLDQGLITPEYQDQLNCSPLHIAAKKNAPKLARLLLQKGATLNLRDNIGDTPLHVAVGNGTKELVSLLLTFGAYTEIKNIFGSTAMHILSRSRNESILLLLIKAGADIEARDSQARTPLGNAILSNLQSTAQILIRHGANVNAWSIVSNTLGALLFEAVRRRKEWAVNLLLENGADLQAIDGIGHQALYYAVNESQESMVKVLLDRGAIKNAIANPLIEGSPLHCAVSRPNLTIVEMILTAGADVNEKENSGNTPLHEIIRHYGTLHAPQAKIGLLLKFRAQINIGNSRADTPLHLAVQHRQPEAVQMLLDAGANIGVMNAHGETALDLATNGFQASSDPQYGECLEKLHTWVFSKISI